MSKKEKKDHSNPHNLNQEKLLWQEGYEFIAGIDECGRGPFAGPVVAGAVIMPRGVRLERLTDSKKIPKKEHEAFAELVKQTALSYSIGVASVEEIDKLNIKKASRLAMKRALDGLSIQPNYILVDGNEVIDTNIPQKSMIKGDYYSHSISAGAIIAKVYRDQLMKELDEIYDNVYNWKKNAGYQSKEHIEACHKYGVTEHHRKSWKTMSKFDK